MTPYSPVRALERGLSVLSYLASEGPSTPRAIGEKISVDRTTVYRLLQTLTDMGFVKLGSGGRYHLTAQVLDLAKGFHIQDTLLSELSPILHDLHQAVLWPVAYASFRGTTMVVEESTSAISPYAVHVLKPGRSISLTRTSLGRAVLAAMPFQKRRALVAGLDDDDRPPKNAPYANSRLELILQDIAQRGYAYNVGELDKTSGISLAVKQSGLPIGAINLIFFITSMSLQEAADQYLPAMRHSVDQLENILNNRKSS